METKNIQDSFVSKLNAKEENKIITINGEEVQVKAYLPIEEKISLISIVSQNSLVDGIFDPVIADALFKLYMVYEYTNIKFTEEEREDEFALYDILNRNKVIEMVTNAIPEEEYDYIFKNIVYLGKQRMAQASTFAGLVSKIVDDLPKNAEAAVKIMDSFDPEKFQAVMNFAKAANGGREIPGLSLVK